MKTESKLLFYSGKIDFNYLKPHFEKFEFETLYLSDNKRFVKTCESDEFVAIIVDASGMSCIENSIVSALSGSKNLYTPVLIISGKEDVEIMQQASRHYFDFMIFPFDPEELMIRINASIRRKEVELTIHRNLKDYRVLMERFPKGIMQTDQHGKIIRYNELAGSLLNMHEPDFSNVSFFQLCHPDDYLIQRQNLDRLLRKEVDIVSFEIRLINNDGMTRVCRISASCSWYDEQTIGSFIFAMEEPN